MFLQKALATFIVTICPAAVKELASKKTLSAGEGTQVLGGPPEEKGQWFAPSLQLPVPATQKKF